MKIVFRIIAFINITLLFSCEKNITLTPPPYNDKPSIQSMLEVDSVPVVYFNRTVPYFGKDLSLQALTIRNAVIQITSNGSTDILHFDSSYSRTYCQYDYYYKGNMPVQLNKTYTLTVVNGADTYTATTSTALFATVGCQTVAFAPQHLRRSGPVQRGRFLC